MTRPTAAEVRIDIVDDRPTKGMWHCGPNACWITATHLPTMTQVRVYSGSCSQHQTRQSAMDVLEMILDHHGAEAAQFPDRLANPHEDTTDD